MDFISIFIFILILKLLLMLLNIAAYILERDSDVENRVVSLPAIIRTGLEELAIGC